MFLGIWHANTQIQIHKYTSTRTHKYSFSQYLYIYYIFYFTTLFTFTIFFYKVMVRGGEDLKNNVPESMKYKYTNTCENTQLQLWSKLQKCLICYIFQTVIRPRMENTESLLFTLSILHNFCLFFFQANMENFLSKLLLKKNAIIFHFSATHTIALC